MSSLRFQHASSPSMTGESAMLTALAVGWRQFAPPFQGDSQRWVGPKKSTLRRVG
ncbi:hypothetical protein [Pantoea sp. KPR_PJ]|uniref:hypothetical protein n=1 Tax=Pantoea sp. KPR_PJ TaxID=2738375 RepID=UPI003528FB17